MAHWKTRKLNEILSIVKRPKSMGRRWLTRNEIRSSWELHTGALRNRDARSKIGAFTLGTFDKRVYGCMFMHKVYARAPVYIMYSPTWTRIHIACLSIHVYMRTCACIYPYKWAKFSSQGFTVRHRCGVPREARVHTAVPSYCV